MFAPIPLDVMARGDISANAKLLYARLILYIGENETAWPSRETLAEDLGIHLESVKRAISELVTVGMIVRKQRGHNRTNQYRVVNVGHIRPASSNKTEVKSDPLDGSNVTHIKDQPKKSPKKGGKRGSRIEEDWRPDERTRARCAELTSDAHVEAQIETFIDYWIDIPGQRGVKLAWDRTFLNWIKRSIEFGHFKPADASTEGDGSATEKRRAGLAAAFSEKLEGDGRSDFDEGSDRIRDTVH